jgi:DNA-binding winged helix-turn-helix (wHTH) protein/Tol biopolymer transport system component
MESTASSADRIFRFGQFELLEREGELRKNGVRIKLQEQPFRVLFELLASAGRVVTREQLQQKLWPADTFVDFDVGLNTAIRKIRQALGDDADRPHFIETSAKRGYKFLAPVSITTNPPVFVSERVTPTEPRDSRVSVQPETAGREFPPGSERRGRFYLLVAFAVIAFTVGVLWRVRWSVKHPVIEKRITANPAEAPIVTAIISPDGKYVAYVDPTGVYLRQIDGGEIRPLPQPKNFNAFPNSWFPDSTHLLVTSFNGKEKSSLWKASILGGTPQMLAYDAGGGVVSPDGSQIAFFRVALDAGVGHEEGSTQSPPVPELWLMASNGENPHKAVWATEVSGTGYVGTEVSAVSWSPSGHELAYIEHRYTASAFSSGDFFSVKTRDLITGKSEIILSDQRLGSQALCWAPDGRLLYASLTDPKSERSDYGVWAIEVDQRTGKAKGSPERVSEGMGWIGGLSVTANGKRLVVWRGNTKYQVFVSEFDKGAHHLTVPRRLTMDQNANLPTAWMPDSKSVLFLSDRNGAWKLFRQEIDQQTAEVLVEAPHMETVLPSLSADGSKILFVDAPVVNDPLIPIRLMSMSLSGGMRRMVLEDRGINHFLCARTPSSVCVFSKTVGTAFSLTAFDTERGKGRELARLEGWHNWSISPNGSHLVIVTDDHLGRLRLLSLDTGVTRDVIVKGWPLLTGIGWTADSADVLVGSWTPSGVSVILEVDMEGNAQVLLEGDSRTQVFAWAIPSPDGRYAALNSFTGENNVWMVEDF